MVDSEARTVAAEARLTKAIPSGWMWVLDTGPTGATVLAYEKSAWEQWATTHRTRTSADTETWVAAHGVLVKGATAEEALTNASLLVFRKVEGQSNG